MADFEITVSNSMNVFGQEPATKWGDFNWGEGFWGFGSETTLIDVEKLISENVEQAFAIFNTKGKLLVESIPSTFFVGDQVLTDGKGYVKKYPFSSGFSKKGRQASIWTRATRPDSTWGES